MTDTRLKIMVAMSGGVDSAVTAALLVEQGHDVIGVTMHLSDTDPPPEQAGTCCAPDDAHDARRVAAHLGIKHYVANYKKQFKTAVIDRFIKDYQNGMTPSPCVRCNDVLKFKLLVQRAEVLGCDRLATGHYARIVQESSGRWSLRRAAWQAKDQSYFLFGASQDALSKTLFPVGGMTKPEVRAAAERFALPVADKPESQDICFVPDGDYARFVEQHIEPIPGEIVDESGEVLGRHGGVHKFTIGQRRGLGLPGGTPRKFVIGISSGDGRIVVGGEDDVFAKGLSADRCNWIAAPPVAGADVLARIRHRSTPTPARVVEANATLRLEFVDPVRAVAPGQAAVLYDPADPDRVLGGGWIRDTIR